MSKAFVKTQHSNDRCNYSDDNDNSAAMYIVRRVSAATLAPGLNHQPPGISPTRNLFTRDRFACYERKVDERWTAEGTDT
uniref:Uncharacterized protein n=1 Tax=Glossina palpalis gambiensis TaxID=67801 RepID=A0A1B0AWP5_9MUSC